MGLETLCVNHISKGAVVKAVSLRTFDSLTLIAGGRWTDTGRRDALSSVRCWEHAKGCGS